MTSIPITATSPSALLTALRTGDGPGGPVVVIDLDAPFAPEDLEELAARATGASWVLIGRAEHSLPLEPVVAAAFDVLLCGEPDPPRPWCPARALARGAPADPRPAPHPAPHTELGELVEHLAAEILASPAAAIALVQLLRSGESLAVADAVVAESWVYSLLQTGPRYAEWLVERTRRGPRPEPTGDVVRLERQDDILHIALDRPEVRNAFSVRLRDELVAALELLTLDPTIERAELRGRGPAFSSGGDLGEFGTAPDPFTAHLIRTTRSVGLGLARHADRVVSFVHGTCVGAGVELPAFTRTVIAHPGTTFRLPEVAMGVVPGAGGTASIPRRIGRHRTVALAISGRLLDAPTALRWGLVDQLDATAFPEEQP